MLSKSFNCVGPGDILAYVRGDLRTATESLFLIGPWLDGYVAQEMVAVAPRTLNARVLVRPERQVQAEAWGGIMAALSIFAGHWADFKVRTLERLHAKCLCIDEQIAYVGSANWYRYSLEQSLEIVLRGPVHTIEGLNEELAELWDKGEPLKISGRAKPAILKATGITHEVFDPLAAEVLRQNPKAFVLGKKKKRNA